MIDTLSFTTAGKLRPPFTDANAFPPPWKKQAVGEFMSDPDIQSYRLECKSIGLRLFFRNGHLTSIEVELPKLLWGHNGRLITTPEEFNNALAWLAEILTALLKPAFPNDGFIPGYSTITAQYHFTRIDLCWQFPSDRGVFFALSNATHDKIRSSPSFIRRETVVHRGSFLSLKCYDKVRQLKVQDLKHGVVHRVEFSLRGKALNEIYRRSDGTGYTNVTFDWCMDTMRKIASETHADVLPRAERTTAQFVAEMERRAPMVEPLNCYLQIRQLKRQPGRRFQKEVAAILRANSGVLQFKDFFPSTLWPPPCHVDLPENEEAHREWLPRHLQELRGIAQNGAS